MRAEMLVVPTLDEPNYTANGERHSKQHTDSAQETEGEHIADDWPPANARIPWNGNPKTGTVEGLSEIDHFAPRASNAQRGHPCIQRAIGHAICQPLQRGLLKPVSEMDLVCDAPPQINANAVPGTVLSFH